MKGLIILSPTHTQRSHALAQSFLHETAESITFFDRNTNTHIGLVKKFVPPKGADVVETSRVGCGWKLKNRWLAWGKKATRSSWGWPLNGLGTADCRSTFESHASLLMWIVWLLLLIGVICVEPNVWPRLRWHTLLLLLLWVIRMLTADPQILGANGVYFAHTHKYENPI